VVGGLIQESIWSSLPAGSWQVTTFVAACPCRPSRYNMPSTTIDIKVLFIKHTHFIDLEITLRTPPSLAAHPHGAVNAA